MSQQGEISQYLITQYLPGTPAEELPADYDLLDNGVIDSLSLLQLVGWVSERYAIALDQIDLNPEDFRSVAAVDRFITRNTQVSVAAASGREGVAP
ncbi:phosphopantetheine-binding protein [Dactylosporangium sp. NPDC050688]|uniref:phosphopantetheine-binding protein n=1 Tax=Dactylosporangium sp. NPDC050688 TaxID=3157217 RepID=UPI003411D6D4